MKKKFWHFFLYISIYIFCCNVSFANPLIDEYVLEDGMYTYVLEDFSSPLVRVELSVQAGISCQSPDNAGFFPLYTKLFKYACPLNRQELSSLQSECNSDSARYVIYVTPQELKNTLQALSKACFEPLFLDEDIFRELSIAKKEVTDNAFSIEGFINSAIDSRVFSESPWKHDSGIYPNLFSKINASSCRLILSSIAENFYKPKNCSLYLSGPVTKESALLLAESTFGKVSVKYSNKNIENNSVQNFDKKNNQRFFVLADPEFSPEMTQLVVLYKSFDMEECDVASAMLNNDNSTFKTLVTSNKSLGINSSQYINVAATHKNDCSRLIVQALMENPKSSPCKNALDFFIELKLSGHISEKIEYDFALQQLKNSFEESFKDSSSTMDLLSQFWAVKNYSNLYKQESKTLVENFFDRPQRLENVNYESIKQKLTLEDPFVFVLVNSNILKKYQNEFIKNGFSIVTTKNGSWYTQKLYDKIKKSLEDVKQENNFSKSFDLTNDLFVKKNQGTIKQFYLENKIPIYVKNIQSSSTVSVCLMIDGGEVFDDKKDYGLESVIVNSIALKVDNCLYQKLVSKEIQSMPEVKWQTDFLSSAIYVECLASDLYQVLESFSEALIFSDFTPAMVDSVILERKSNQIVKTSSPVFQLYSNGISSLYKNKEYQTVYSLEKNILKKIDFTKILERTTKLFNAANYKIIICGNIINQDEFFTDLQNELQKNFGMISVQEKIEKPEPLLNSLNKKSKKIKLVHLFLTDVSKDKAGPRPQVLIPTTEFLDPAQFWIYNYASSENSIIFNALLNDFAQFLDDKCSQIEQKQKMSVISQSANDTINFGQITFLNVKTISVLEEVYKNSFEEYKKNLSEEKIQQIKNNWIKNYMSNMTNSAISLEIKKGLDSNLQNPEKYIEDYNKLINAQFDDFVNIFDNFEFEKVFRLYSNDTK